MSARAKGRGRGAARRAYTIIEVMMAMSVLGIGATGVMAMQKVTLAGNQRARALATATMIAQTWAERLRADAVVWNNPNGASDLNETRWLVNATLNPFPAWILPQDGGNPITVSAAADSQGRDILPTDPGSPVQAFCTELRFLPLTTTNGVPDYIRAEIRVFWAKGSTTGRGTTGRAITCAEDASTGMGFVYVTTGFTPNTIQN